MIQGMTTTGTCCDMVTPLTLEFARWLLAKVRDTSEPWAFPGFVDTRFMLLG